MSLPLAVWMWWRALTWVPDFKPAPDKRPLDPEEQTDTQDAS